MNKTLTAAQKAWIVALRSGKYKQGKDQLQSGQKFCCLGVACLVYEEETGNKLMRSASNALMGLDLDFYEDVQNWLSLRNPSGKGEKCKRENNLINLNDGGHTFDEIADIIEKNTEDYFYDKAVVKYNDLI